MIMRRAAIDRWFHSFWFLLPVARVFFIECEIYEGVIIGV